MGHEDNCRHTAHQRYVSQCGTPVRLSPPPGYESWASTVHQQRKDFRALERKVWFGKYQFTWNSAWNLLLAAGRGLRGWRRDRPYYATYMMTCIITCGTFWTLVALGYHA